MSKTKTKSDAERREFLTSIGLSPEAPGLTDEVQTSVQISADLNPAQPAKSIGTVGTVGTVTSVITLVPDGLDPRTIPVEEITFDEHLLDGFSSLSGDGLAAASAYVFSLYKSHGRNKDRNGALHRKITSFITLTRRNRETGGMVSEGIKTTKEDRDIAALLASQGITASKLAEALTLLAEKEANR